VCGCVLHRTLSVRILVRRRRRTTGRPTETSDDSCPVLGTTRTSKPLRPFIPPIVLISCTVTKRGCCEQCDHCRTDKPPAGTATNTRRACVCGTHARMMAKVPPLGGVTSWQKSWKQRQAPWQMHSPGRGRQVTSFHAPFHVSSAG